jgi:very-short-patch-repair endonuclease
VDELPEPDWYFDNVLAYAQPGRSELLLPGPAEQWQTWWRSKIHESDLTRAAAASGFVLTTRQLLESGITRSATRAAVRRQEWTSAGYGRVAPISVIDDEPPAWLAARRRHALLAAGSALTRADHVISANSAAIVHGLPTMSVPRLPQLTETHTDVMGRRSLAHVYSARLDPVSTTYWFGAPVTTVARTIVDQARHGRRDGLMAADAALREGLVTDDAMRVELADAAGWPGIRQARQVWEVASPQAESALESVVRLALHDAGFPPPQLQVVIGPYRVDLCWPERKLIIEADGEGKYRNDALRREKRREHYLHVRGWRVIRLMWADVLVDWPLTQARLWRAFGAA